MLEGIRCKNSYLLCFICYSTYLFVCYSKKRNSVHILLADYSVYQMHSDSNCPNQPSPPASLLFPLKHISRLCQGGDAYKRTNTNTLTIYSPGSLANIGLNHISPLYTFSTYKRSRNFKSCNIIIGGKERIFCVWSQILQHIIYPL